MKPSVGVCTLPIDFNFHDLQNFEHLQPTNLSVSLLTMAAFTRCMSTSRGSEIADITASFVISLNEILFTESKSERISFSLHAINSPSLSGSVAINISFTEDLDALLIIADSFLSAFSSVQLQGGLGNSPSLYAHIALLLTGKS